MIYNLQGETVTEPVAVPVSCIERVAETVAPLAIEDGVGPDITALNAEMGNL